MAILKVDSTPENLFFGALRLFFNPTEYLAIVFKKKRVSFLDVYKILVNSNTKVYLMRESYVKI